MHVGVQFVKSDKSRCIYGVNTLKVINSDDVWGQFVKSDSLKVINRDDVWGQFVKSDSLKVINRDASMGSIR